MSAPICRCGASARHIHLEFRGLEVGTGYLCGTCLEKAMAEAEVRRGQFEALLAAGVSREDACKSIDGKGARA